MCPKHAEFLMTEFVLYRARISSLLRSPGIDSQPSGIDSESNSGSVQYEIFCIPSVNTYGILAYLSLLVF
jgi:hypothetical protein